MEATDDVPVKYEDLNLRAQRLSEKLRRISTESIPSVKKDINDNAERTNDKQSEEVQAILRRYSGILGAFQGPLIDKILKYIYVNIFKITIKLNYRLSRYCPML